ncbi:inositol-tetrakisphosphate 1-kinase 1-like [Zingiber officinale]|uniref:inositol-1,3,4-trisphosphate 5/6-kinase n=1 Tax=Zingiber officinale TaxID=94328 RepID=A0A8J5LRZ8_ZINOF|nr:inositol-tetrakisphosphate 1-kinase 1-like [Zingiber officinale]KAG6528108.1 hypothetical protein ZIOFF_010257 [Zingiber officinale]
MTLLFRPHGLLGLKPPMVFQEFVNHGGVIFKVYVTGNYVQCMRRKSLPGILPEEHHPFPFVILSRVSNTPWHNPEDIEYYEHLEVAELPPLSFLEKIAKGLQKAMRLHLFNFGIIRDANACNIYFIINID